MLSLFGCALLLALTACGSWSPTASLTVRDFLRSDTEISLPIPAVLAFHGVNYTTAFLSNKDLDRLCQEIVAASNQDVTYTIAASTDTSRTIQAQTKAGGSLFLLAEATVDNPSVPADWFKYAYFFSDFSASLSKEGASNLLFLFPAQLADMQCRPFFSEDEPAATAMTIQECAAFYDFAGECYGVETPYTIEGTTLTLDAAFVMVEPEKKNDHQHGGKIVLDFGPDGLIVSRV